MRRLLRKLDWSFGDNLIQCFAGASRQATDGALSIRRRIPRSGLVHPPMADATLWPQRGMKTGVSRRSIDACGAFKTRQLGQVARYRRIAWAAKRSFRSPFKI